MRRRQRGLQRYGAHARVQRGGRMRSDARRLLQTKRALVRLDRSTGGYSATLFRLVPLAFVGLGACAVVRTPTKDVPAPIVGHGRPPQSTATPDAGPPDVASASATATTHGESAID